ncbi:MAG: hypothetical protein P8Y60_04280 [Calditrichota bacterium]|jgi:hypothetical protein
MKGMHFNFKDLFRAPRLGFSLQRIWINSLGLLAGYLAYLIITYISFFASGYSFLEVWYTFGLLPCAFAMPVPWYGTVIYIFGLAVLCAILLLTNTAVARVVYMTLRDELFYTWTQAYKFALKKWVSSVGAMLTFIFIIAFFVVAALIMGLIGRIPYVGELGTSLLTIPYIFTALLLFFIILAFFVGTFFVPAILATSDEDALGGVFQSFSITFNQPWRIVVYTSIIGILEFVGFFLFAASIKISYNIFYWLFSIGMGDKISHISKYSLSVIDHTFPALYHWAHALPSNLGNWIYMIHQHSALPEVSGTIAVSGYIFAVFMVIIGGSILAYAEAIGNSGLTIIYVILYKLQENENLLEREDEELKEEEEEEKEEEKPVEGEIKETEKTKAVRPKRKTAKPASKQTKTASPRKKSSK